MTRSPPAPADDAIRFYSRTVAYHELSNFSPHGFEQDGAYWPTVEHYFQAQKFAGPEHAAYRERIRRARTPKEAKMLGRSRTLPLRADWEAVKEHVHSCPLWLRERLTSSEKSSQYRSIAPGFPAGALALGAKSNTNGGRRTIMEQAMRVA